MAHHLRYHVARNGVFIVHCAVGITDKVIVIKSFLCCFMPEISAQIRHHHLEVNAFFRPQVHPVNHKRETEVMDGWFVCTVSMGRHVPELCENVVYGCVSEMFLSVFCGEKPFRHKSKVIAEPGKIIPAALPDVIGKVDNAVLVSLSVQHRPCTCIKIHIFCRRTDNFTVPHPTAAVEPESHAVFTNQSGLERYVSRLVSVKRPEKIPYLALVKYIWGG